MGPFDLALTVLFRPADAYIIIKREYKNIKLVYPVLIYAAMVVLKYLSILLTHRPFQSVDISDTDLFLQIAVLVIPPITYCISVFGLTCVSQGETEFRCIFITTAYCYTPYLLLSPLNIILSQVLTLEESGIYYGIIFIMNAWIILLIFGALIVMNNYSFFKGVRIAFLSIIGIILIWIVFLLAFAFVFQIMMFIIECLQELQVISL